LADIFVRANIGFRYQPTQAALGRKTIYAGLRLSWLVLLALPASMAFELSSRLKVAMNPLCQELM
tara:strand:- start:53 stop:247 length:195 start_codon:yes stop_codon:yes gene_type:complete